MGRKIRQAEWNYRETFSLILKGPSTFQNEQAHTNQQSKKSWLIRTHMRLMRTPLTLLPKLAGAVTPISFNTARGSRGALTSSPVVSHAVLLTCFSSHIPQKWQSVLHRRRALIAVAAPLLQKQGGQPRTQRKQSPVPFLLLLPAVSLRTIHRTWTAHTPTSRGGPISTHVLSKVISHPSI